MIKEYHDNYIDLKKISHISSITHFPGDNYGAEYWSFGVVVEGHEIFFEDENENRLASLRDRVIKDWMEAVSEK